MGSSIENAFSGGALQGNLQDEGMLGQAGQNYQGALAPWINSGSNNYNQYQQAVGQMQNPASFYQSMMSGYQETPQAQQQIQQGIKDANAATAASGMQGSGAEQTALQKQGQQIVSADQQNYLNNMMGIWGKYLGGMGGLQGEDLSAGENSADMQEKLAAAQAQLQGKADEAQQGGKNSALGTGVGLGQDALSDLPFGVGSFF